MNVKMMIFINMNIIILVIENVLMVLINWSLMIIYAEMKLLKGTILIVLNRFSKIVMKLVIHVILEEIKQIIIAKNAQRIYIFIIIH